MPIALVAPQIELAVLKLALGDELSSRERANLIMSLTGECFYIDAHKVIWEHIVKSYADGITPVAALIDVQCASLNDAETQQHVKQALIHLDVIEASPASVCSYISVLKDLNVKRQIYQYIPTLQERLTKNDASGVLEEIDKLHKDMAQMVARVNIVSCQQLIPGMEHHMEMAFNPSAPGVFRTGFITMDKIMGQFREGDLVIVAGRPSSGKTTLLCNLAYRMAKATAKIGIITLEMTANALMQKIYCLHSGSRFEDVWMGDGIKEDVISKWKNARKELAELSLWFYDEPVRGVNRLTHVMDSMFWSGIDIVMVDYIQRIGDDKYGVDMFALVSAVSRSLKDAALQHGKVVIATSQLSRLHVRENRPPNITDLRESGRIEEDADVIILLDNPMLRSKPGDIPHTDDVEVSVNIAKRRLGGHTGKTVMYLDKGRNIFYEQKESNIAKALDDIEMDEQGSATNPLA